ncbi:hypothetical protein [Burkholderia territorii]|uniref:hypothetical protein n=1 Tax=Burkholderia territorii TaxID=1503055 RepID=UPI001478D144|nr:hypothetical protein [Burkholderia territorii]
MSVKFGSSTMPKRMRRGAGSARGEAGTSGVIAVNLVTPGRRVSLGSLTLLPRLAADLWFFVADHRQNALSDRLARRLAPVSHADAVFVLSANFTL